MKIGLSFVMVLAAAGASAACTAFSGAEGESSATASALRDRIPNGQPFVNAGGQGATFSTEGGLDLSNAFHTPLGNNGRSCAPCHLPEDGWSVSPRQIEQWFTQTKGQHPIFAPIDANSPSAPVATLDEKRASYSMLRKGLFRRGGAPPATRDFDIVSANDAFGWGSTSPQRFSVFRRPLATANFHLTKNVGWDDNFTRAGQSVPAGLFAQASGAVVGAEEGPAPPNETVDEIVGYESALSFAQVIVPGAGRLDANGANGGPELLSKQAFVRGRFDLFDAWRGSPVPARAAIARGQDVFNAKCLGCHDAANNGSNVDGRLFDIGASDERWASIDGLPIYTVKNRETGDEIRTTDPGKANRTGKWSDMNRFKVPSLRGLAARAPYFHNGVAKDLLEVVRFYEVSRGFEFTPADEGDLVAFMNAL